MTPRVDDVLQKIINSYYSYLSKHNTEPNTLHICEQVAIRMCQQMIIQSYVTTEEDSENLTINTGDRFMNMTVFIINSNYDTPEDYYSVGRMETI